MRRTFYIALIVYTLALLSLALAGMWYFPFSYSGPPIHPRTVLTDILTAACFCVVIGSFLLVRFGQTQRLRVVASWCIFGSLMIGPLLVAAVFVFEAFRAAGFHEALFYRGQATGCILAGLCFMILALYVYRRAT